VGVNDRAWAKAYLEDRRISLANGFVPEVADRIATLAVDGKVKEAVDLTQEAWSDPQRRRPTRLEQLAAIDELAFEAEEAHGEFIDSGRVRQREGGVFAVHDGEGELVDIFNESHEAFAFAAEVKEREDALAAEAEEAAKQEEQAESRAEIAELEATAPQEPSTATTTTPRKETRAQASFAKLWDSWPSDVRKLYASSFGIAEGYNKKWAKLVPETQVRLEEIAEMVGETKRVWDRADQAERRKIALEGGVSEFALAKHLAELPSRKWGDTNPEFWPKLVMGHRILEGLRNPKDLGRPDAATNEASTQDKPTTAFARAYGGKQAYEKAKASGQTELTYNQWLQVRTEAFKAWFGDWEALSAQNAVDAMQPVKVTVPDEWRGLPTKQLRAEALKKLQAMVGDKKTGKGFVNIKHPELGVIRVDSRGFKKTRSSSGDPAKILVAADVQSIIPQTIYARSELPDEGSGSNLEGASKLFARVDVDGVELIAIFTILREADGNWYYNTVTVHDAKAESRGSITEHGRKTEPPTAPFTGLTERVRKPFTRVNRESVSKEINPRTGEPLPSAISDFNARNQGNSETLRSKSDLASTSEDEGKPSSSAAELGSPLQLRQPNAAATSLEGTPETKGKKPVSSTAVLNAFAKVAEAVGRDKRSVNRVGFIRGKNALGVYNPGSQVTRIRTAGDTTTGAHELAHLLDDALWGHSYWRRRGCRWETRLCSVRGTGSPMR